jgi:hypothetical protein
MATPDRTPGSVLRQFKTLGVTRILVKELAPNDNSKNQIYVGRGFESLNLIPVRQVSAKEPFRRNEKPINFKAKLDWSWLCNHKCIAAPRALFDPSTFRSAVWIPEATAGRSDVPTFGRSDVRAFGPRDVSTAFPPVTKFHPPLYFHTLLNCPFSIPFVLTFIHVMGGWVPPSPQFNVHTPRPSTGNANA